MDASYETSEALLTLTQQYGYIVSSTQLVRWEQLLESATDFDLLQTRDELYTWLMRLRNARHHRGRLPDDYPNFDLNVSDIFRSLSTADQALVLVGCLALRSLSPSWLSEITFITCQKFGMAHV